MASRESVQIVTKLALKDLSTIFEEESIDFFLESDLQSRLYEILRKRFRDIGELRYPAKPPWTKIVQTSKYSTSVEDYDEWYENHTNTGAKDSDKCRLTRVHTETWVKGWEYLDEERNRLDIAVLDSTHYRPIQLFKGRKQVEHEAIGAAIELKYLRSKVSSLFVINSSNVDTVSFSELVKSIILDGDIEQDLQRLEEFSADSQRESYFVLATHYDPLFRGKHRLADSKTPDKQKRIGKAAIERIVSEYPHVNVLYMYPDGSDWLQNI